MVTTPRALRVGQDAVDLYKKLGRLESALGDLRLADPAQDWDAVVALLSTSKASCRSALQRVRALLADPTAQDTSLDAVERDLRLALLCLPETARAFVSA